MTDKDIVEMIMFPVVNEACRVLAEKIVVQASDLDIASVLGMGFPPYRCGRISDISQFEIISLDFPLFCCQMFSPLQCVHVFYTS